MPQALRNQQKIFFDANRKSLWFLSGDGKDNG
jgi:hypothetical protein